MNSFDSFNFGLGRYWVTFKVRLPAAPLPVGVAVMVTDPVPPTNVPVAVVELLPEMVMICVLLLLQSEAVVALRETLPPEDEMLTLVPEHPEVQLTVVVVCPIVTETWPLIVPLVAVIVTPLLVLATLAVTLPLVVVLSTDTWVSSSELQSTELVRLLLLPSS